MKLIGRDTRFEIKAPGSSVVAGAYFNDVTFSEDPEVVDVSVALSNPGQRRVDENTATATISATGFIDVWRGEGAAPTHTTELGGTASDSNFIDLAEIGTVVDIRLSGLGKTTVAGNKLYKYKPWQISKVSLKFTKRAAAEDTMELIGTGGAIPDDYTPGMIIDW